MQRLLLLVVLSLGCLAAPRRVLYVTHSAGFRHGSIGVLRNVMESVALGGMHSATDTLYNWPEYGDLIGGYFDGHPWVHEAVIDVEDPDHPTTKHLGPSFRLLEEFYQFRAFSRDRVRVLMTLDTRTVNPGAEGVNRTDGDFALAWCRNYGAGRVFRVTRAKRICRPQRKPACFWLVWGRGRRPLRFYSALGHFDETWLDGRFQKTLEQALLWLTKEVEGDGSVRASVPMVGNLRERVAPGALVVIEGEGLTSGTSLHAASLPLPVKLAGTMIHINGLPAPLVSVSPKQVWMQVPFETPLDAADLRVISGTVSAGAIRKLAMAATAPEILAIVRGPGVVTIYCTGLGAVQPPVPTGAAAPFQPLSVTTAVPVVMVGGNPAQVLFSGLAPGLAGVYQVNAASADPGAVSIAIKE